MRVHAVGLALMVDSFAARKASSSGRAFQVTPFGRVPPATKKAAARHAQRYGDLLGGEVRVTWP